MRLLVLGGTHHVGRAAVETALARGDQVTVLNRGVSRPAPRGVRSLRVDRTRPGELADGLPPDGRWDVVLDTWTKAPWVVRESATALEAKADAYVYISSRSVYVWPPEPGSDESAPVVDGDPAAEQTDYPADKRGGELAVLESFGPDRSLLARAGLVLGPYEVSGRLPWWLHRIASGGRVLAPGPADRPLQLIDGRDLAAWTAEAAYRGVAGTFNTVSPRGHATMGSLLAAALAVTGSDAELVWTPPEVIEEAGIQGWTALPIWVPPTGELAGLHDSDVSAAAAAGLDCRPIEETVADTWRWIQAEGYPPPRADLPPLGISPEQERAVLAALG